MAGQNISFKKKKNKNIITTFISILPPSPPPPPHLNKKEDGEGPLRARALLYGSPLRPRWVLRVCVGAPAQFRSMCVCVCALCLSVGCAADATVLVYCRTPARPVTRVCRRCCIIIPFFKN
jgi:hypothetical protein